MRSRREGTTRACRSPSGSQGFSGRGSRRSSSRTETDMLRARANRVLRHLPAWIAAAYLLLLCVPRVLFAHELSYGHLIVYSREPLDKSIYDVLDRVESRLAASGINEDVDARIFLTNGFDVYALLSLYVGSNSFGKSYAALPTQNVFINKADAARDLVFRSAPAPNERSLSGVIAHEITHLWMRKRFGYWRNIAMPAWKKEGYAEYVAGGSTLDYATGRSEEHTSELQSLRHLVCRL